MHPMDYQGHFFEDYHLSQIHTMCQTTHALRDHHFPSKAPFAMMFLFFEVLCHT